MLSKAGKKRASPGADVEKNPLQGVELSDEDAQKLHTIQKDIARAELILGLRYVSFNCTMISHSSVS
jgi:template-activating factor I